MLCHYSMERCTQTQLLYFGACAKLAGQTLIPCSLLELQCEAELLVLKYHGMFDQGFFFLALFGDFAIKKAVQGACRIGKVMSNPLNPCPLLKKLRELSAAHARRQCFRKSFSLKLITNNLDSEGAYHWDDSVNIIQPMRTAIATLNGAAKITLNQRVDF
jgi:hypothetical protein